MEKKKIHILVLEAFDKPRPLGQVARHLDDNQDNNHISNLCWGTHSENVKDKYKNGYISHRRKLSSEQREEIKGSELMVKDLAHKYQVHRTTITRIKND